MKTALIASLYIGLWSLTTACDSSLQVTTTQKAASFEEPDVPKKVKLANEGDCIDPDLTKLANDVFMTLCNGELGQGQLDLSSLAPAECIADGDVGCMATESFKAADMSLAVASNIKSGASIAGVAGSVIELAPCSADGDVNCAANVNYKAAAMANFTAANIASGVTIAGVLGTGVGEAHVNCTGDGAVGCVTTAAYKSADTGAYDSSDIKSGITIAGVAGTLGNCANGESGCVVQGPTFKAAAIADLAQSNIKSGATIAGETGTYGPACASDGASNCVVDGTTYIAAATATAVAGNIKKDVVIAGVTGKYPSATYPLAGANSGIDDLNTATFNAKMKASANFEWFDSTGNIYTRAGELNIAAGFILNGVSIFGTVGSYDPGAISVSSLTATKGADKVALSWTRNGGDGVIIVRRAGAAVTFTPTHGVNYAQGYTSDNDKVVYRGSAATFDDTDVAVGTIYRYMVFAYNADNGYSAPSNEVGIYYTDTNEVCGGAGDSCYDDAAAKAAIGATTPLGKSRVYVDNGNGFMVWKDAGSNKILRANGLDEWAMKLNLNGKGHQTGAGNEFTNYASIEGRKCPPNVYIDDDHKVESDQCLYYTVGYPAQRLDAAGTTQDTAASTIGLNNWNNYNGGGAKWYVGNIKTCSDKGMRLPTVYETATTTTTHSYYPSDASPQFALAANGIPSHASGYTWTASAYTGHNGSYWLWSGPSVNYGYYNFSNYVRCILP